MDFEGANKKVFDDECYAKEYCEISIKIDKQSMIQDCSTKQNKPVNGYTNYALFFEFECDISEVDLPHIGIVSRRKLANIVIACDAIICLMFAINIVWLARSITNE